MLIAAETFDLLKIVPWFVALGPVIGVIVWTRRHADRFRALSAGRQILVPFVLVGWAIGSASLFAQWDSFVDTARVWRIHATPAGIVKDNLRLIGTADYRFADGPRTNGPPKTTEIVLLRGDNDSYRRC